MSSDNVKVAIKVRPLIKREKETKLSAQWRIHQDSIECTNPAYLNYKFSFDHICDEKSSTSDLYSSVAKPIVESSVNGFNGTIFAYGQTSSGKTHTMLGTSSEPGVMILAVREIFEKMRANTHRAYLLRASYIEIYNERIYDLFNNRNELKIQEHSNGDINVNCIEKLVASEQHIMELVQLGNRTRIVAETNMNVQSSRSHTIFSIIIESQENNNPSLENEENEENDGAVQISVLNLVDLAGSERADSTGATGSRLKEGGHINKSLLSLSLVINKLSEDPDQQKFINYRDSKLTRILQPSLGGNAMTAIICTITPAVIEETNYTLGFANRAKRIKNKPIINEILSDAAISKRLKKQILVLEQQLAVERMRIKQTEQIIIEKKQKVISCHTKISRRRTWAPDYGTPFNLSICKEETLDDVSSTTDQSRIEGNQKRPMDSQLTFRDEEFRSCIDCTFGEEGLNVNEPLDVLIPPSLNNSGRHSDGLHNVSTVNGIDKDNRIKHLEKELDELQNFQKIESLVNSSFMADNFKFLDSNVKEKDDRILELENQLRTTQNDVVVLTQRNSQLEIDWAEANKLRELAECNLTGVEYEYEQYKSKSKVREKELIDQINGMANDDQMHTMQSRIKELSVKLKDLETEKWKQESSVEKSLISEKEINVQLKQKNEKLEAEVNKTKKIMEDYHSKNMDLMEELVKLQVDKPKVKLEITCLKNENIDMYIDEPVANGTEDGAINHSMCTQTSNLSVTSAKTCENCNSLNIGFDVLCITAANYINKYETECDEKQSKTEDVVSVASENVSDRFLTLMEANQQLKKQIKLLKRNLTSEQAKCKELLFKNDLLKNSCNVHKINSRKTIMEFHILRRFYGQLESHIKLQDEHNKGLENELDEYKERYNDVLLQLAEAETTNDNLSDMRSKYDNALKRIEELTQNDEKLLEKEQELTSYKDLQMEYEDAVKRLASNTEKLESAEEELLTFKDFQEKYNNTLVQIAKLEQCLEQKSEELSSAMKRIENLTENLRTAEQQDTSLKDLKAEYNNAKKYIEDLSEDLHIKIQEVATYQDLQVKYDDALKRIDELNESTKSSLQEKDEKLNFYKNLEEKYDDAIEILTQKDAELSGFKNLEAKHNDALKRIDELNEKLDQTTEKVENLKDFETSYKAALEQLNECNRKLSTTELQLTSYKDLESKYNDALKNIGELKQSKEDLLLNEQQNCKNLMVKYNDAMKQIEEYGKIKENLRLQEQQLAGYANVQASYSDALQRIESLNESIKRLQLKQQESTNKINLLLSEKNTSESERQQLLSKHDSLIAKHKKQLANLMEQKKIIRSILDSADLSGYHSRTTARDRDENDLNEETKKITFLVEDRKKLKDEINKSHFQIKHLNDEKLKSEQIYQKLVKEFEVFKTEHVNCKHQRDHTKIRQTSFNSRSFDDDDGFIIDKSSPKGKAHDSSREINDIRNTVHHERKIKRQSFHDDTRRVSGFDTNQCDVIVQTEPSTESCQCAALDYKISQLRREILIKDAKINTMHVMGGVDVNKRENDELKAKLASLQDQFKKEHIHNQRLNAEYEKLKSEKSVLQKMQLKKCSNSAVSTQTEIAPATNMNFMDRDFVAEKDFYLMSQKYQTAKKHFLDLKKQHDEILGKFEALNAECEKFKSEKSILQTIQLKKSSNSAASTQTEAAPVTNMNVTNQGVVSEKDFYVMSQKYQSAKQHFLDLKKQYDEAIVKFEGYMKKYDVLKKLCQIRGDDLEKLKAANEELKTKLRKFEVC